MILNQNNPNFIFHLKLNMVTMEIHCYLILRNQDNKTIISELVDVLQVCNEINCLAKQPSAIGKSGQVQWAEWYATINYMAWGMKFSLRALT